jgi:predicted amidohydrolase YtcJ
VREAVHAYTVGSAYASFQDHVKGSLQPAKLADLAVLSKDIFAIDAEEVRETTTDITIVGGEVVYQREGSACMESAENR